MRSIPVPRFIFDRYKLFAVRIAFSKLTICYFIFSVLHCVIQVGLQGHAFSTNANAARFLWDIVVQGDAKVQGVLDFGTDLRVCDSFESALSHESCQLVWDPSVTKSVQQATPRSSSILDPYSSTSNSIPSSSITPTTSTFTTPSSSSSSVPAVTPPRITPSLSSSFLSTSPTLTRSSVTLPTPSPRLPVLVGGGHDEETESDESENDEPGPELVVLKRRTDESLGKIYSVNTNGQTVVRIEGLGHTNSTVVLGRRCLISLNWPATMLDNTKREDIVFIAFQFWVLGMSIVAILNESIPHIIASLFTHMVATGWGAFQIVHTNQFRTSFSSLTTNGACGINLLPEYWGPRRSAEIASLALNILALLIGIVLSWRLLKAFGWRTFKRIGASIQIRTQYRVVLILSVTIQLALFFIVASAGLWLDQLINGVASQITRNEMLYKVMTALVLALLIPWLALGWTSVRKEQKILMAVFLGMSALYLASWGAMFISATFRWTFLEWRFFSLMATASVLLTLSALITGIVCRLGFGTELPEHLNANSHTEDEDTLCTPYVQDDISEISTEKVKFPPLGLPVPTFSSAFRSNDEESPPERPTFPNPQMGPRFFYGSTVPFDQQTVLEPAPAHIRKQPPGATFDTPHLYQYDDSSREHSRANSNASADSSISRNSSGKKRWSIE